MSQVEIEQFGGSNRPGDDDQDGAIEAVGHSSATGMVKALSMTGAPQNLSSCPNQMAAMMRRLETVTNILRGWVWETNNNHRFTFMSDSVSRFAGKAPEWHYGKTRQELGNLNTDNVEHQKYLQQLDAHEMFGPVDFVRYQNGRQLWMRTIGMPQFDAEGAFVGYCGLAFDVTQEIESRQGNRRSEPRRRIARSATISEHDAITPIPCVVLDISEGGARLDVPQAANVPNVFRLCIDIDGNEHVCEVKWRKENSVGVKFLKDV